MHVVHFPNNVSNNIQASAVAVLFDVNNYDILKSHINLNIEGHCSTSIYIVIQNI